MRYFLTIAAFVFQLIISASAQGRGKAPEPDRGPEPVTEENPNGASNSNGQFHGEAPGVPGALAVGSKPRPAPKDDSIDFDHVADALKELIDKISNAVDDSLRSSSSRTAHAITTPATIPIKAMPCSRVLVAYGSCSTAYSGTFSAVAKTVQAGCLCNAFDGFDFNINMQECYSYAQNQTQYQNYASVIANATAACTCDPDMTLPDVGFLSIPGCTASPTTTSIVAGGSSGAGSGAGASPLMPLPTTSGALRNFRIGLGTALAAVVLAFMSVLY